MENERRSYVVRRKATDAVIWKKEPLLSALDMELTERCNNDCVHCYINLPEHDLAAKDKELTAAEIKAVLREAASLGCISVRFTGGEPLLREDFEDLYLFARKLGLKVMLFTNGMKITPRLAGLFARIPPLEKIEITVYGMRKKSYESVSRVPGSYKAAWRGIRLLLEKEIPFVVKGVLLPPNKTEIDEFKNWASTIPGMDKKGPDYVVHFDFRVRRDSERRNRLIQKLRLAPDEIIRFLGRNRAEYVEGMKEFCSKFISAPKSGLFSCGAGVGRVSVDAYGFFHPCLSLKSPLTRYDLKKGSLKDALTTFIPKVREMTAESSEYLRCCARCFLKGFCEQCPARSWMEQGTLDTPVEYLCRFAHAQAVDLGLLREGEQAWDIEDWKARISAFSTPQGRTHGEKDKAHSG